MDGGKRCSEIRDKGIEVLLRQRKLRFEGIFLLDSPPPLIGFCDCSFPENLRWSKDFLRKGRGK
jgi:hypothetical protein